MHRCRALSVLAALALLVAPAFAEDTPVRYDNYKFIRTQLRTQGELEALRTLDAILMSDYEGIGPVDYVVAPAALRELDALGIRYRVLDDDVQRAIDAERARLATRGPADPRDPDWFEDYKNFAQIVAKLEAMAADFPDRVTLLDIGDSVQGREIWCLKIATPGENKPAVLYDGLQHAREWIGAMVSMWLADRFVYDYDTDPEIQALLAAVDIYIVPVVNPDGYVYAWDYERLWRKNRRLNPGGCYGVDLNRNWGGPGWGGPGSSGYECDPTYRGPEAFSEPETQAVRDFVLAHPEIIGNIDYHNYSQLILSPWGYTYSLPPDNETFLALGEAMHDAIFAVHGENYDWGPIAPTLYQASGGSVDWFYDAAGAYSYTIELRPTGFPGFELPADEIIPTCQENYPAALLLANFVRQSIAITFPSGLPAGVLPDMPKTFRVKLTEISADYEPGSIRLLTRLSGQSDFAEHELAVLEDMLFEATLPGVPCGKTLQYCIRVTTTAGAHIYSIDIDQGLAHEVVALPLAVLMDVNMDSQPLWSKQGLWQWGQPTGDGGAYGFPDPTSGYTGTHVFGYNLYGDYEASLGERYLTTHSVSCNGLTGTKLSFYRWLGVETPTYDHAAIRISNSGGLAWATVWQNTSEITDNTWVYQEFDIGPWADGYSSVQLRWVMGPTDSAWQYCGWNIDDVLIWAPDPDGCPGLLGDLDCDDEVGFGDINAFVLALSNPEAYAAAFPECDRMYADCNEDGTVDFKDINPFVLLLSR